MFDRLLAFFDFLANHKPGCLEVEKSKKSRADEMHVQLLAFWLAGKLEKQQNDAKNVHRNGIAWLTVRNKINI